MHNAGHCYVAWQVLAADDHGYGSDAERSKAQARELARDFDGSGFAGLMQDGRCAAVLAQVQKKFVRNMEVEEGIAMNEALSENLFVTCICVLNLLPLFIVGKPGTSKTLTMQVLQNNLQGSRSPSPFFRDLPAIHVFPFQCSPMSNGEAISRQFEIACRFQLHATSIVSVLLFDEVGLAEHSPDMPLKVLHSMLVKPPIAIVGLSNWTLDSAKMNRAICIQRTDPSALDVELTASSIVGPPASGHKPAPHEQHKEKQVVWLKPICFAYHSVYASQHARDFLGMRDLYACVKKLSASARGARQDIADEPAAEHAVMRNFAGKPEELHRVLVAFHSQRLSIGDPHGLTQGMAEVVVSVQHTPGGAFADHLTIEASSLPPNSVVRRGVLIEHIDHGHSCILERAIYRDGRELRPCDLILPGDVLVSVECKADISELGQRWEEAPPGLESTIANAALSAALQEASASGDFTFSQKMLHDFCVENLRADSIVRAGDRLYQPALSALNRAQTSSVLPFQSVAVDTPFEASRMLRKLNHHTFELKLLRRADCVGEVERVAEALAAAPSGVQPTVNVLTKAGLPEADAARAVAQVAHLESYFRDDNRFSWPNTYWRAGGLWSGWKEAQAAAERQQERRKRKAPSVDPARESPGNNVAGAGLTYIERVRAQREALFRQEEETRRSQETESQQRARKRQEELAARQAALIGKPLLPAQHRAESDTALAAEPFGGEAGVAAQGEVSVMAEKEEENDPFGPDTRISLNEELVTVDELLTRVEAGEVMDPLTGVAIVPESFVCDGERDEVGYELARRRVGLPARAGLEDAQLLEDPLTRKGLTPANYTRYAQRVITARGVIMEEIDEFIYDADGMRIEEHDPVAYERARRRVGLPWRKEFVQLEREGRFEAVAHLGQEVSELLLTRIVPGTSKRMTRLQQHTLFGPAGQPAPCCWQALFGRCTLCKSCRVCDHGATVPALWISKARRRTLDGLSPPLWPFMAPEFQFDVPAVELVRGNLADRASRHLMLLTHNAAALQLLFDGGLLREEEVDVLFGSRFKEDLSELMLVQQVNRVKVAMAKGHTIVLVNHDNIYEALYDVLNQRYLVKRDPRTGETRRLLRLAIGSRSQLCVCHDDFKVVVIVESQHAYERLDLPLLNRFEKQVLTPAHALVPAQQRLCGILKVWTEGVAAELGLCASSTPSLKRRALAHIFCGYHDGMLASLALQLLTEEIAEEHAIAAGQAALLCIAKPLAVFHSQRLRALPGSGDQYFASHSDLLAAARCYFVLDRPKRLYLLLTQSPLAHCEQALREVTPSNGDAIHFTLTQLARFGSEDALGAAVDNFLSSELTDVTAAATARVLLIQYDPATSAQGLLEHAMYIVQQRHAMRPSSCSETAERSFVAIVVHLPPGTSRVQRRVALDFSRRWAFVFVDDLRVESSSHLLDESDMLISLRSLPELLERSLHELLADESGRGLALHPLICAEARAALGRILPPMQLPPDVARLHSYTNRVQCVDRLLRDVPEFGRLLARGVLAVLARHATPDACGMHAQAAHAKTIGGTCRDAVRAATRRLLTRALAHVFAAIDEDFNMSLLDEFIGGLSQQGGARGSAVAVGGAEGAALWLALGNCAAVLDLQVVARSAKLGGAEDGIGGAAVRRANSVAIEEVANSGKHGPLVARFPFSARLVRLLESKDVREAIAMAGASADGDQSGRLVALLTAVLGTEVSEAITAFATAQPEAYLHDLVASTTPRFPGLTFGSQLKLHALVLRALAPDSMESPGTVHTHVWGNERRLHHAARMLGSIELDQTPSFEASEALGRLVDASPSAHRGSAGSASSAGLARIDLGIVVSVIDVSWRRTAAAIEGSGTAASSKEAWCAALSGARLVAADVDALLLIATSSCRRASSGGGVRPSGKAVGPPSQALESTARQLGRAAVEWRALLVVHLFAQEVVLGDSDDVIVERAALERLVDAARGLCMHPGESPAGSSQTGIRVVLQAAEAAAARADPRAERLGGFVVAFIREVVLRASLADGEPLAIEGGTTLHDDLVDVVAGTADWLPSLPQPARELLLHALCDAGASVPSLSQAIGRLCTRGAGGSVLVLRQEERRLRLLTAESTDDVDFVKALRLAEAELQMSVRLADATDRDGVESATRLLHGASGLASLQAATKAKLLIARYTRWLAEQLRQGKTTLKEPLPSAEPVRVLVECNLLSTKPLAHALLALRLVYRTGGPGLLRKLLALPTDASPWVPVPAQRRSVLQSSRKRTVLNPFSLLIEPAKNASRDYTHVHSLAAEAHALRTTDAKRLERLLESFEELGARDGVRAHDNSLVTALVASAFVLRAAKPKLSELQQQQAEKRDQYRLEKEYGKKGAAEAERTEQFHLKAASDAMAQLIPRRFESAKLREVLHYVLGGCEGNTLLPSPSAAARAEAATLEELFEGAPASSAAAAASPAAAAASSARTGAGGRHRPDAPRRASAPPLGVAIRRGPGEGFVAGMHLSVYLAMRVASHAASSFWATLLFAPAALATMYVPTMAGDEFAMIMAASDYAGWYKCPNGHPYSVGHCTRPMQLARCPACNARIGGQNHEDVQGVTRIGTRDEMNRNGGARSSAKRGYHRDDLMLGAKDIRSDMITRAGEAAVRVLRIFMHLLLHLHGASTGGWRSLHDVIRPPDAKGADSDGGKVERSVRAFLEDQVLNDWLGLQTMFGLDEEQVMIALVLVASRVHLLQTTLKGFESESMRSNFETAFEVKCVQPIFDAEVAATVIAQQTELDPMGDVDSCRTALGVLWEYVSDESPGDGEVSGEEGTAATRAQAKAAAAAHRLAWLWALAPDASLHLFKLDFGSSAATAKRLPLIAALLKHEKRLPLIGCAADVLRWHAVLLRAFRHGLRRQEAQEMTNAQAIERLPQDQQAEAWEVLRTFCDSFNRSFVLVERLYECQANPYLYEAAPGQWEIDLSGSGGQTGEPQLMGPDVSVLFSLPSMVAGAQDADGLCTVQLCNVLSAAHNELMDVLQASSTALLPRAALAPDAALPTISYQSSPEVMRQQLLSYSPERDLLPLLAAHRVEGKGKGKGRSDGGGGGGGCVSSSFDLPAIEHALAHTVFARATQLVVHVHHFEYQGELLRTGKMSALKERVPQRPLPPALLQAICDEVDTAQRQEALLALLEQAVAFLSALGTGTEDTAEQPLREYASQVLLLSDEAWKQASTHGVEQHVHLCHLQSLFVALEEGTPDALERVHPRYRQPLPSVLEAQLRIDVRLRRSVLLPVLHEFITTQLVDGSWPADANLKQYLTFTDPDLEDAAWYVDAFPEALSLCHALALHAMLAASAEAASS